MRTNPHLEQTIGLLGRALAAGAVVELAGRALVLTEVAGPVIPRDRSGHWPPFSAAEPGIYACCPLLSGMPAAILAPGCYGWLRLGEVDELAELLPVAEWLAALGRSELRGFAVGLLHGLGRIAETGGSDEPGARPLIRSPDSLARELFG
jgi:hypothetical protein